MIKLIGRLLPTLHVLVCLYLLIRCFLLPPLGFDSGTSRHICVNACAFIVMQPLHGSNVTLSNQTSIPVCQALITLPSKK